MAKIPGVNHQDAIRALQRAGFRILRQGKHVVMSDGVRVLVIPRDNPINAYTMGGIAKDAGLTPEEFKNCCNRVQTSGTSFSPHGNMR